MDKETMEFLLKQNNDLKEDMKEYINLHSTSIRGAIKSEVDRIDEMDKIRNGRIERNKDDIELIKKETAIVRWINRHPRISTIIAIAMVALIALGAHEINLKRTIEKVTNIELKEHGLPD